jgi:predicted ATPase
VESGRFHGIVNHHTPDEYYPLGIFPYKQLERFDFEKITILYGGNGSGKTTLLNIMAEKLGVFRHKEYLQTAAFQAYLESCNEDLGKLERVPPNSKFLASDDIFQHILSVREKNRLIKQNKTDAYEFSYSAGKYPQHIYPGSVDPAGNMSIDADKPEDFEKFFKFAEARRKTSRQFVRSRCGEMQRQYSNGENALMFFDKEIEDHALYFLDEPENSMSPQFQFDLKELIEDSSRYQHCQFVIATHSPILLSLKDAKIYNLDVCPVTIEKWYELENVRFFYEFFKRYQKLFEETD